MNGAVVTRKNDGVEESIENSEPLREECLHFLRCIETRQQPLTDGESGLQVLRVLDAAEQSLSGGGVPVDLAVSSS